MAGGIDIPVEVADDGGKEAGERSRRRRRSGELGRITQPVEHGDGRCEDDLHGSPLCCCLLISRCEINDNLHYLTRIGCNLDQICRIPSFSTRVRAARAARSRSWVTMTRLAPRDAAPAINNSNTAAAVCRSRLPVGSSARRHEGLSPAPGRWPPAGVPRRAPRPVADPVAEAHRLQHVHRPSFGLGPRGRIRRAWPRSPGPKIPAADGGTDTRSRGAGCASRPARLRRGR